MTFDRYYRLFATLLVFTGFYAILITGNYLEPVIAGMAVTGIAWFFGESLARWLPVPRFVWNLVAVGLFVYLFHDTFYGDQDLVGNGIKFVVYLQIVKLLSPKTGRDELQIFLLSFLHILAATVLSSDISFSLPFLTYIVLATWTLTLFNLKSQQEQSVPLRRAPAAVANLLRSREVITRRFLIGSSGLSLAIIAMTLVVFFLFPRLSLGQFLKRATTQQRTSGFSDTVELGSIGNIKTNNTIVMRVEYDETSVRKLDPEYLYWRGTATDHFNGRRWIQSSRDRERINVDTEDAVFETERAAYPGGTAFSYRVFLESLSTPILFGADRLYRVTWDKPIAERFFRHAIRLERDAYLGFHFVKTNDFLGDFTYGAESTVGEPRSDALRQESAPYPYDVRQIYLQLPPLDPDVQKLLESIELPDASPFDRANAIQTFLERNYRYTLDVQDVGTKDPLRFFLIEKKQGHCEYFSTALVMALRLHGIPSRQVMGFRGGEVNEYGHYIAVRQRDAHSWVEVYFPRYGWVRFDPSPLDSTVLRQESLFKAFYQFTDYLRLRWNKYIIEYDLRAQASWMERVGRQVLKIVRAQRLQGKETGFEKDQVPAPMTGRKPWLTYLLLSGILLALAWHWIRRKRRRRYGRISDLLNVLSAAGFDRLPGDTPREHALKVERECGSLPPLSELLRMYEEERFGGRSVPESRWKKSLEELEGALKRPRTSRLRRAA